MDIKLLLHSNSVGYILKDDKIVLLRNVYISGQLEILCF